MTGEPAAEFPPLRYAAEGAGNSIRYGPDGNGVWVYPAQLARDVWALPNGNVRFCPNRDYEGIRNDNPSGVRELTPDRQVVRSD